MVKEDKAKGILIEQLMLAALQGEQDAAATFYRLFLRSELFVLYRSQEQKLQQQPIYPNQFFNIMAVQDGDKVIVPTFTTEELISTWCAEKLRTRALSCTDLLQLLPEDWYICLNPGSAVEKEFTPWEIAKLKQGQGNVAEVVEELYLKEAIEVLEVTAANQQDHQALIASLKQAAPNYTEVRRLFLACENGRDIDNRPTSTLLLGIEALCKDPARLEKIKDELSSSARLSLIGDQEIKVRIGASGPNSMILGIFKDIAPFYQAQEASAWHRLVRFLRRA